MTMLRGVILLHLEEVAVIDHAVDDVLDVVGHVRLGGHQRVERFVGAVDGIGAGFARRVLEIVRGHEAEQLAHHAETLGVVVREEVRYAGLLVVRHRSAELVLGDLFVGDRLDDFGAGDEHVGGLVDHEDEVGHGGGVDRSTGAGAHDGGDLRHHAGRQDVAQEDVGVAGERLHAFLNTRAAGVVEADDGSADAHGHVHHLDDLGGVGFGERAAEDGEVLGEDEDQAAFDASVAGEEAVADKPLLFHAEVGAAVRDQFVGLFECAFVEQELDALAGGHLALLVFAGAALFSASGFGECVATLQFGQLLLKVHARDYKQQGEEWDVTGEHGSSCQWPVVSCQEKQKQPRMNTDDTDNEEQRANCGFARHAHKTRKITQVYELPGREDCRDLRRGEPVGAGCGVLCVACGSAATADSRPRVRNGSAVLRAG